MESTNSSEKVGELQEPELEEQLLKKLLEVVERPRTAIAAMPASIQQPGEATQLSAVDTVQAPAPAPRQVKNEKALGCSHGTTNGITKGSPRQSNQHSVHSEEERSVRLASSGFQFAPCASHLDWRRILAVNDTKINKNGDITTLESILPDIAFGGVDWSSMDVDPTLRKAYEAAQLSCQYLLHCQEVLKTQCGVAERATHRLELQALVKERQGRDMRNVIRRLKQERQKQNRLISTYSGMLRQHNPELAARVYIEEGTGDLQLLSQAEVDEGVITAAGDFEAELICPPAVNSLFNLQKHNQRCTAESKEIDRDEPTVQFHERGYTEGNEVVNGEGLKVQIESGRTPSSGLKDKESTLSGRALEDNPMEGQNDGDEVGFQGVSSTTFDSVKQLDIETISIEEGLTS